MNYEKDRIFFGADMSTQEMDVEFKKLYDDLLSYKKNIFHLVDTICSDCEAGERLAINIAERDSSLLQRLVAKECESRRMVRKEGMESVQEQLRVEVPLEVSVQQVLQERESSIEDVTKKD